MTIIKVLLQIEDHLTIVLVFHHEDSREDTVEGKWVLSLQLNATILAGVLRPCQESRPVLVCHLIGPTANHLHGCRKLSGFCIAELPCKRGHEVLAEWQG